MKMFRGVLVVLLLASSSTKGAEKEGCANTDFADEMIRWEYVTTPPKVHATLIGDWNVLDPNAATMIDKFRDHASFSLFPHARDVFKNHLIGTFSLLGQWNQGEDIVRAGLFHTGYSGDLFGFAKWNADNSAERDVLEGIIGKTGEELTFLFGTVTRGALVQLSDAMKDDIQPVSLTEDMQLSVASRIEKGNITLSAREVGKLMIITMADYMDQAVEVNGWRDHHQIDAPLKFYPGEMKPAVCLYWISKICKAVRDVVDDVPPIFNNCHTVLSREDETSARDLYWDVVLHEETLSVAEQDERLERVIALNPFIGEPHLFRAQIAFRGGNYELSKVEAKLSMEKFFTMGTAWDKRISYQTWVAHCRMLLLRSNRNSAGLTHLPYSDQPPTSGGLPIVMLDDLIEAFDSKVMPIN